MKIQLKWGVSRVRPVLLALFMTFTMGVAVMLHPSEAISATLLSADQAAQVVTIRNLTVKEAVVSGELLNKSSRRLRDVQLLIRHTWLWNDEFHPGRDDLGVAVYYTVEGEMAPGSSRPFTYRPSPPLPSRADGQFEVTVSVAGFTEIIPGK
jgi:hypothetical protein